MAIPDKVLGNPIAKWVLALIVVLFLYSLVRRFV
jgi:hypothetical protein